MAPCQHGLFLVSGKRGTVPFDLTSIGHWPGLLDIRKLPPDRDENAHNYRDQEQRTLSRNRTGNKEHRTGRGQRGKKQEKSLKKPEFSTPRKDLVSEGTVPVPPNRPGLCDGVVVPSRELSLQGGCHSGGGGGITCCSPLER